MRGHCGGGCSHGPRRTRVVALRGCVCEGGGGFRGEAYLESGLDVGHQLLDVGDHLGDGLAETVLELHLDQLQLHLEEGVVEADDGRLRVRHLLLLRCIVSNIANNRLQSVAIALGDTYH